MQPALHPNIVCFGEIYWDMTQPIPVPAGSPLSLAHHINTIGAVPTLITRIGKDEEGRKIQSLLDENYLSSSFVQIDGEHPTGKALPNDIEFDDARFEFVFPSAWDHIKWEEAFNPLLKKTDYFIFSSLVARSYVSRDTLYQLLDLARVNVFDLNLTSHFIDRLTIEFLLSKTNILKLDLTELELLSDWYGKYSDPSLAMKFLKKRFPLQSIIVTRGKQGVMLMHDEIIYEHPGYPMETTDTNETDNAFLAALLTCIHNGSPYHSALDYSCAASAIASRQTGNIPNYHHQEILELMRKQKEHSK